MAVQRRWPVESEYAWSIRKLEQTELFSVAKLCYNGYFCMGIIEEYFCDIPSRTKGYDIFRYILDQDV